jgi:hypothetical protein
MLFVGESFSQLLSLTLQKFCVRPNFHCGTIITDIIIRNGYQKCVSCFEEGVPKIRNRIKLKGTRCSAYIYKFQFLSAWTTHFANLPRRPHTLIRKPYLPLLVRKAKFISESSFSNGSTSAPRSSPSKRSTSLLAGSARKPCP